MPYPAAPPIKVKIPANNFLNISFTSLLVLMTISLGKIK